MKIEDIKFKVNSLKGLETMKSGDNANYVKFKGTPHEYLIPAVIVKPGPCLIEIKIWHQEKWVQKFVGKQNLIVMQGMKESLKGQ